MPIQLTNSLFTSQVAKTIRWIVVIIIGTGAALFLAVNIADYERYKFIVETINTLPKPKLEEVATFFAANRTKTYAKLVGEDIPAPYKLFRPTSVSLGPHMAELCLYESQQLYAWMWIEVSDAGERIHVFHNFYGGQRSRTLWQNYEGIEKKLSSLKRLVTISVSEMGFGNDWVISDQALFVVNRASFEGQADRILFEKDLDGKTISEVKAAIAKIPGEDLGKIYRADGVSDGIGISMRFNSDGGPGKRDVILDNEWRESFGPLLELVSFISPEQAKLPLMALAAEQHKDRLVVIDIEKEDAESLPPADRWILWRKLFLKPTRIVRK